MPNLPVTVTSVTPAGGGLYGVTVAFYDGTVYTYLVPQTMATVDAVRISALVLAQLLDIKPLPLSKPHRKHQRYTPRTVLP